MVDRGAAGRRKNENNCAHRGVLVELRDLGLGLVHVAAVLGAAQRLPGALGGLVVDDDVVAHVELERMEDEGGGKDEGKGKGWWG